MTRQLLVLTPPGALLLLGDMEEPCCSQPSNRAQHAPTKEIKPTKSHIRMQVLEDISLAWPSCL